MLVPAGARYAQAWGGEGGGERGAAGTTPLWRLARVACHGIGGNGVYAPETALISSVQTIARSSAYSSPPAAPSASADKRAAIVHPQIWIMGLTGLAELQRSVLRADLRELDRPTPKSDLPVSKSDTAICPDIRRDLLSKADTEEAPGIACVFA